MAIPKAYEGGQPYVFICYSHLDIEVVHKNITWLSQNGVNVWYDQGISPGSNWRASIGGALLGASVVLAFISKTSLQSTHCNGEISLALDEGIPVLPIYLEEVELTVDLKVGLNNIQALWHDGEGFRDKLLGSLPGDKSSHRVAQPSTNAGVVSASRLPVILLVLFTVVGVLAASFFYWNPSTDNTNQAEVITEVVSEVVAVESPGIEFYESLAVMPLTAFSADPDVGFLAKGITDRILDELSKTEWLKLASRTTAFALAENELTLQELAELMKVAYILEGSVQESGQGLRITAQLIRAQDNFHVWSDAFTIGANEIFGDEEVISQRISSMAVARMWTDVKKEHPELFWEFANIDPEAVELFLEAEEQFDGFVLGDGGDFENACSLYAAATKRDVHFQVAFMPHIHCTVMLHLRRKSLQETKDEIELTLKYMAQNDPKFITFIAKVLADNYLYLNYKDAEIGHRKILEFDPGSRGQMGALGDIAAREGRVADAIGFYSQEGAGFHEPGDSFLYTYPQFLIHIGEFELALTPIDKLLRQVGFGRSRSIVLINRAHALIGLGRLEDAKTATEEAWKNYGLEAPGQFVYAFAKIGEVQKAENALKRATPSFTNNGPLALGYLSLGDTTNALKFLKRGIESHDLSVIEGLRIDVALDELRDDPRFDALLMRLTELETNTDAFMEKMAEPDQ